MEKIIVNGRVIDPANRRDEVTDILVADGQIKAIGQDLPREGREVVDAQNCLVLPGLVDLHVHLREPGQTHKETIATGTRAAAAGGFTTVACMPNTTPVVDNPALVEYIRLKAAAEAVVNVLPICAITRGSLGEELADLATLKEMGAAACSDDGRGVMNSELMRRALEYAGVVGLPLINHCEDTSLAQDGVANEGYPTTVLGLKGSPAAAEEVMVARDLVLAAATGYPIHLAHISTAGSVALIREAKARGVAVTAEVAPHHLTLTEGMVEGFATNAKVNPPLRTMGDVTALQGGLADGTIDIIATDHAPHSQGEKAGTFGEAPFGISGLETALAVILTHLVAPGIISLHQAVAALTIKPAQIIGLNRGTLGEGVPADLTIVDPNYTWTVDPIQFYSKGQNTPYTGSTLQGKPRLTMVAGRIVLADGKIIA